MHKFKVYAEVFNQALDTSLTKAVDRLLMNDTVKTKLTIAKKTNISPSTLTGYMNGKINISRSYIEKFREVFGIDISKPLKLNNTEFEKIAALQLPDVSAIVHLTMSRIYQNEIRAQQIVIEGLKKTNEGLMSANEELYNYILSCEKN